VGPFGPGSLDGASASHAVCSEVTDSLAEVVVALGGGVEAVAGGAELS
jgi:hypothetical protein